jgi:hypothetical protein
MNENGEDLQMKNFLFLLVILTFFFSSQNSHTQIVGFYPSVDTLLAGGGCTPPEIICHEFTSSMYQDSIAIDPGWNTWMFIMDSMGSRVNFDNSYFLVNDSSDQYEYEVWVHPQLYPSVFIPFDTPFLCDFWEFDIQLIVKEQGVPIDSLSQPFRADYGLGIEDEVDDLLVSRQIKLFQNYPNPFNPVTTISFLLPKTGPVKIEIFDVVGNRIETLLNSNKAAGAHEVHFDGSGLASGIYLYRIQAGDPEAISGQRFVDVKKMVLIK